MVERHLAVLERPHRRLEVDDRALDLVVRDGVDAVCACVESSGWCVGHAVGDGAGLSVLGGDIIFIIYLRAT
jgi:hypothetical protein